MEPAFAERKHKTAASRTNRTGIPGGMKQDFETRSGLSFDDVRVHYNSQKPAKLGALAYTRGTQVYLGPGQERHLPHELGHVVQQKRGLVRPTGTIGGLPVNTDAGLEAQADHILQMKPAPPGVPGCVVQCYDDESVNTVLRLCHKYGCKDISRETVEDLCRQLDEGKSVRIPGKNKMIKYYPKSSFRHDYRTYNYRPQGAGDMGRCAAEGGTDAEIMSLLSFAPINAFSAVRNLTKDSIAHISKRSSLNTVMGGSAWMISEVDEAEYLHMIAHCLGGPDTPDNLMPGYHALNTAMIPFESFARNAVAAGYPVTYRVDLLPHPGFGSLWVNTAQIQISVSVNEKTFTHYWTIYIPKNEHLSKRSYIKVKRLIQEIKSECGL